jgi:CRP/FNR family cyclic AMP-dependent transcriptional regulator
VISREHLLKIAFWARDLTEGEIEQARRGIVEKTFPTGSYICHRGDRLESWTGVVDGLAKMGTVSKSGKDVTFAGLWAGGWFGEGTILKDEARRYDIVALRETRMALMSRATFLWLFEHSVAFNRFLVRQLNERLGQFIAIVEYDRTLEAPERVALNIAWLFNPVLFPGIRCSFPAGDRISRSAKKNSAF